MSLYYFITRYLYPGEKIRVYCYGVLCIEDERRRDVELNDKYESLMKKDIVRILSNDAIPGTIIIYVE